MKKRFLSIFLSSAMALSLLSGCAGGGSSAESTTVAANSGESAAGDSAAKDNAAGGDKAFAGQTLSVYVQCICGCSKVYGCGV